MNSCCIPFCAVLYFGSLSVSFEISLYGICSSLLLIVTLAIVSIHKIHHSFITKVTCTCNFRFVIKQLLLYSTIHSFIIHLGIPLLSITGGPITNFSSSILISSSRLASCSPLISVPQVSGLGSCSCSWLPPLNHLLIVCCHLVT